MHTIKDVYDILDTATFTKATESDMKRSNANVNADSSMGAMLTYGSETARLWVKDNLLSDDVKKAVDNNVLWIHDCDFYALTFTCCQIELDKLFHDGFDTGHGHIREPNSIATAAALCCIAIQSNQNDMFGGQAIPAFDFYLAPYVKRSYEKNCVDLTNMLNELSATEEQLSRVPQLAWIKTVEQTQQAMEALIHNLNTMNSRAGAQVPFSSINYGTDTSKEGRLVTYCLLEATERGLGNGETPIFPVQIFKVKEGVNYNPDDPNYDLFQLAMEVSATRLFPNFSFLDSPFNKQYYVAGDHNTEVAYMGCRTRVMGNVNGPEVAGGRGNISFSTINLVKCALSAAWDVETFEQNVLDACDITLKQLLERYEIQKARHVFNYPFLMGNGVYLDSENLAWTDTVEEALKHGTLSIGFIGLAESMKALFGEHHGESKSVYDYAYRTIAAMRKYCDEQSKKLGLNITLLATPAEGLSGKFVIKDREEYGEIEGVTDKEYYTNSFHIPVYYQTSIIDKIDKEAPFHELCNAGHITYVELDGDPSHNLPAFEAVIRCMHDSGIGYGSVNHPIDRCPICGFRGIIYDECPLCHRKEFEDVPEEYRNLVDERRKSGLC